MDCAELTGNQAIRSPHKDEARSFLQVKARKNSSEGINTMKLSSENNNDASVLKKILQEKVDPSTIPLEELHAGSVRLMTRFSQHPSPSGAFAVIRLLEALDSHMGTLKPKRGESVYRNAIISWTGILNELMTHAQQTKQTSGVLRVPIH